MTTALITRLTPREQQVLHEIGLGLTNREIGFRLGIAEKTVKNTVTVVLAKLGLRRRAQAAAYIAVAEATGGRVSMLAG
ncbi:response regulator transcription factor [Nakamurella lactea]|uniref:response regulator transcription factor n=1 Tax=Nakamurella lactea TaxID=459515 RepID=UPI00041CA701|nr:LuxR C-terminal-related transcriptional regulator [Nakamurella lactea]